MNPLKVLIVGAGNIASRFDLGKGPERLPLTHAGAFSRDQHFEIAACIEPDEVRRKEFSDTWNVHHVFNSFSDFQKENISIDVVSICSPTNFHQNDIQQAIQLRPRLIFCEKPVSLSSVTTKQLLELCQRNNIKFAVNYSRRWDPDIIDLKQSIRNQQYGALRSINGVYNKGLLNNGSHMIDLIHYLLGDIKLQYVGSKVTDYYVDDPTIPLCLDAAGIPVQISIANAQDYSIFELQFIFAERVIVMRDGGLYWQERTVVDSPNFRGYKTLSPDESRVGRYQEAMQNAVDNIYGALTNDDTVLSQGDNAVYVQEICEKVITSAR